MKEKGEMQYYVRVCIVQDKERKQVYLYQEKYIENIFKEFGQTEAKPVSTPADLNVKLQKEDGVSRPVDMITYQSIVGDYFMLQSQLIQILLKQWELCQSSVEILNKVT